MASERTQQLFPAVTASASGVPEAKDLDTVRDVPNVPRVQEFDTVLDIPPLAYDQRRSGLVSRDGMGHCTAPNSRANFPAFLLQDHNPSSKEAKASPTCWWSQIIQSPPPEEGTALSARIKFSPRDGRLRIMVPMSAFSAPQLKPLPYASYSAAVGLSLPQQSPRGRAMVSVQIRSAANPWPWKQAGARHEGVEATAPWPETAEMGSGACVDTRWNSFYSLVH